MVIRGIKSRIFFQLWALFFLSLLLIDILVLFLLFDQSFFPYRAFHGNRLSSAYQHEKPLNVVSGPYTGTTHQKQISNSIQSDTIYRGHRKIQNISFVFVVVNSILFALLGTYQLSRSYFKPLQRLAKRAESYQDESYPFFAVRKEDNEFSVLSTSLNKMLHRISEDKRLLNETIASLEIANAELKKAQNDVIRAEKLATVGRLTSGIAHEIGNPIGIVLGYLDLLKQNGLSAEDKNDFIDRSEKEINRISAIIRQLLDMSKKCCEEEHPTSIHAILNDLLAVFEHQPFVADISIHKEFFASDDRIVCDPNQLRQVYLNILLNAVDAVNMGPSDTKRIVVRSESIAGDEKLNLDSRKRYLKTTIIDNGPGVQTDLLNRIFDPFFTTKEPGKGTGLGLSVSMMIVEKFGGRLIAANADDQGAMLTAIFPLLCDEKKALKAKLRIDHE